MECDFTRKSRDSGSIGRLGVRLVALALVLLLGTTAALAQGLQGKLVGSVTDPTGAMVVGAKVDLTDQATNEKRNTTSGADGHFVFLNLVNGLYKITVTMQGFNVGVFPNIKVDLGRTTELTAKLTVGSTSSEVVVEAASEILQTQTSAVEGTVTGRSLRSLPLNNRDALDFVMLLPGANQGGGARQGTFNNLPKGALAITMDGVNIQDNYLKSSGGGGMFTMIRPKQDAVEEVSVTSATPGADAGADGAVQIKFSTRRGGNEWHGGAFEQYRDQGLNANTFFLNRTWTPTNKGCYGIVGGPPCRQKNHLNQYGFNIGGPIIKDRVFVFNNFEDFRLPGSSPQRTNNVLTPAAQTGLFTYVGSDKATHSVNLFDIATTQAAAVNCTNCRTSVDPFIATQLAKIDSFLGGGTLKGGSDPIENQLSWTNPANQRRYFNATRIDIEATQKLRFNIVGNWNHFDSSPDALNSFDPAWPGAALKGGQYGRRYMVSLGANYTVSNNFTYEFRAGRQSAQTIWGPEFSVANIAPAGFQYEWPLGLTPLLSAPGQTGFWSLMSSRNVPNNTINNNFGWLHGRHTVNFGATLEIITSWAIDPVYGGVLDLDLTYADTDPAASMFSTTTLPAITDTDLERAKNLYSLLAGRVSAIYSGANLDENTKQYSAQANSTQRARQNILALYVTDSFRATKNLTLNYGTRWEYQAAPYDRKGLFSGPSIADAWGKSGIGNVFKPGTLTGVANPVISLRPHGLYDPGFKNFAPSFGFSYSPDFNNGLYNKIFGGPGKTVVRGAYSIAYTREDIGTYSSTTGYGAGNPGFQQSLTASADNEFVAGDLVLNGLPGPAVLPTLTAAPATYQATVPMSTLTFTGKTIRGVDPNLRVPYVQSWQFGLQRELDPATVLEVRYVGNHGTRLWRGVNINEVNIFENHFLDEFKTAQSNMSICKANAAACLAAQAAGGVAADAQTTSTFKNWGLPGQAAMPIMDTAKVSYTGTNATRVSQGTAGALANSIAGNKTQMCRLVGGNLTACGGAPGAYPANLFQVNPDLAGSIMRVLRNGTFSNYNALQVELRRRMSKGLLLNVNYAWAKGFTDSNGNQANDYFTLRDPSLNKIPSPWDFRHTLRVFWDYELPFGPGRRWAFNNHVINKVAEGWEITGVVAAQSGRWFGLTSGRNTVNQNESGVVLKGTTLADIQSQLSVNEAFSVMPKTATSAGCDNSNYVYYLPAALKDASSCEANHALIDFPTTPGVFGNTQAFLRGPRFIKPDITIVKKTKITERVSTEAQIRFFNAFNYRNWSIGTTQTEGNSTSISSKQFGQTNQFFQDLSQSNDTGPRTIELMFRVNF